MSFAQPRQTDITGVWKGEFYVDSTKMYYPFELSISEEKGKYTGYSRIAFEENGIKQVVFRDHTIKVENNIIVIEDKGQLSKASSIKQPNEVKKVMLLTLNVMDTIMKLDGTWSTNKTRRYLSATGSVAMQRKKDFKTTDIFKKLDSLALTEKLSFNKPAVPTEEPVKVMDKIILEDIANIPGVQKNTKIPSTKPNLVPRPKEMPIAKLIKEPVQQLVKEPAIAKAEPKKPVVVATQPVVPKQTAIVKVNPPVTKPVIVPENKPKETVVAVVKKNIPLPDQKNAAVDVAKRSISSIQSLYFKTDSLQLTLYDNGEVDGDTVSVLLNGKVIIAKQGLTTRPNVHTIYFDRETPDSQMLVMYAENLGAIPPNTGLLVVREGQSVYEVRFSADLKTNAAIILRRKKED